ncbi:MAG: peptide chain release factor 2 [Clostridia bacterium]|nr:peptide chain release factor 2 [Clostridia bacterium]
MKAAVEEGERRMADPAFWDDPDAAQSFIRQHRIRQNRLERYEALRGEHDELAVLCDLLEAEPGDAALERELRSRLASLEESLERFEVELLLTGPYDQKDALLSIHPGAGGTESQDWAAMLMRMYTRWAEDHGYKVETLDYLEGEEAGIKSVTLAIRGPNAYGFLRPERGVHRLVRHSPFDASGRRHTSFASVDVLPVLEEAEVEIRPEDLRIDTFRASGAGGQHVNKTESAVRITHLPTGIVVTCQNERSQHANRESAMTMLRARLAQRMMEEREKQLQAERGQVGEIAWGNQIRSYVFEPYTLVKDHRTEHAVGNIKAVMDGEIDPFIFAYLRKQMAPAGAERSGSPA